MVKPYGYIYLTKNLLTGKIYIGKKAYVFRRKKKLTKKELALIQTKGRKPKFKKIEIESDWRTYYGSCEPLQADIKKHGKDKFKVDILKECPDKQSLSYWEVFFQMKYKVLFTDTYNGQILNRFYKGKITE